MLSPTVEHVTITIEPGPSPPASPDVLRVWAEMAAANPRLYNGPILAVDSLDAQSGEIKARRDTYQRLVVQPRVRTGVRQLSVTGVVIGRDERGVPCVLLGKRSDRTRMYAGMWELGPSGGVEPPPDGVMTLDHSALLAELRREAQEEAGIDVYGRGLPLAIVYDPSAESYDVVLMVNTDRRVAAAHTPVGWEYHEIRWVPVHELRALERAMGAEMILPTREIIHGIDLTRYTSGDPL
jgi:8-oxo-dGTP pyrophosphatase MutT (NUDIX family)